MAVVHGRKSCFAMLYARDGLLRKKSEGLEGGGASHSLEERGNEKARLSSTDLHNKNKDQGMIMTAGSFYCTTTFNKSAALVLTCCHRGPITRAVKPTSSPAAMAIRMTLLRWVCLAFIDFSTPVTITARFVAVIAAIV